MDNLLSSPLTGRSAPNSSSPVSSPVAKRFKYNNNNSNNSCHESSPLSRVYEIQTDSRIGQMIKSADPLMATFQTTMRVASIIHETWEPLKDCPVQKQRFINYVVGFVMRIGPSAVTLLHGLLYTLRLREAYPKAIGESGCAHRLFVVSLLVAAKRCRDPRLLISPNYGDWSALSGVFGVEELKRMEREFVGFLKGKIDVHLGELESLIERYLLDSMRIDRVVPGSLDLFAMVCIERRRLLSQKSSNTSPSGAATDDKDATCPECH